MSRDSFLNNVRQAAELGRAYRVHTKPVPQDIGYVGVEGDLCQRLAAEIDAVGGQSYIANDFESARTTLHQLLQEAGARSAVCWRHDLLDRLGLRDALAAPGVKLFDYDNLNEMSSEERQTSLLACDIGISSVDCAIAETGTLMLCSRPGQERLASLLPPMHVAIVERRQIVPDLLDGFQLLHKQFGTSNLPSNVTFITGPSKTGDIELQLTTGVHGPGKWRVIIIQ